MYRRILVPLENTGTDACIVQHVSALARHCGARLLLVHVADGWAARNQEALALRESDEMRKDRAYLESRAAQLRDAGIDCEAVLAGGDPAKEIVALAEREQCDLIAMGTHGHRLLADIVLGSVASTVRHLSMVPVLLVRDPQLAPAKGSA
jgi:nucleotide-binding universal stress UspA family protein